MKFKSVSFACALMVACASMHAQSATLQQQLNESEQGIAKYQAKLDTLQGELDQAQADVDQAKAQKETAQANYNVEASAENERALDRANGSLSLAERKLASTQKRIGFADTKKAEYEKTYSAARKSIDEQAKANERAAQAEKLRQEEEARLLAEQEAALLKEQEEQAAAKLAAAELATQEAVVEEAVVEEAKPKLSAEELQKQKMARAKVSEFNAYLAGDVRKRASLSRLKGSSSLSGSFRFEHLGGEIYFTEVPLKSGEHKIKVSKRYFKLVIPEADNGEVYSIYFDNRANGRGRLTAFKTSLLEVSK
ncbi:hypothetical protein [Agaribacterium sp. ZY112]|uniref:hypothetical protein n=1 Tax=Agaribacterium sp. ZY112 TaxID=3233574 RepID=UPI0035249E73